MGLKYFDWKYKGEIVFSNLSAIDDLPVLVTIPWHKGMKKNFDDIRFTSQYHLEIPYWIESKTDGVSANIWIKLPLASGRAFYYFGNYNAVSESSKANVYVTYADFETGALPSGWTSNLTTFIDDGAGNKVARIAASSTVTAYVKTGVAGAAPYIFEGRVMFKTPGAGGSFNLNLLCRNTYFQGRITGIVDGGTSDTVSTIRPTNTVCTSGAAVFQLDTWYDFQLITLSNTSHKLIVNGLELTCTYSITSTGTSGVEVPLNYGTVWADNLGIRKYTESPPVPHVKKAAWNSDERWLGIQGTLSYTSAMGLHPTFSFSQNPINVNSGLGLKGVLSMPGAPIDPANGETWAHTRAMIEEFFTENTNTRPTGRYSSKTWMEGPGAQVSFSPGSVLNKDYIEAASSMNISGEKTGAKDIIKYQGNGGPCPSEYTIFRGGASNKSMFTIAGNSGVLTPAFLTVEYLPGIGAGLSSSQAIDPIKDLIELENILKYGTIVKFTRETLIRSGDTGLKAGAIYLTPLPEVNAGIRLTPQNYPLKKKWFLIDYNVLSVDIRKNISEALWTLEAEFAGTDCPSEFEGLNHSAVDHNGDINHLFTGVTPESSPSLSNSKASSRISAYDYGYYLSKQYLPDDCLTINLQGSISTWRGWIDYLLKGTGITGYKLAYVDMPDVTFHFTGNTTRRQAIDAISDYCNCIFEVSFFNHGSASVPVWVTGAYWVKIGDIDSFTQGLDLPEEKIFSWPNPYMITLPEVSGNPEEKINRVRIRGTDGTNIYSCTLETAEVTNGDDIARELYEDQEENKSLVSQEAVNSRAAELLAYYENPPYQVTARMIMRYDLRLYQKIKFDTTFPEKLSSLTDGSKGGVTWLRITEINYHCEAGNNYVEFKAISDTETAVLLAAQGEGSYTILDAVEAVTSNK